MLPASKQRTRLPKNPTGANCNSYHKDESFIYMNVDNVTIFQKKSSDEVSYLNIISG